MSKITVNQFAKLMANPKVSLILNATKDKTGVTPKQISIVTKIPTNQLYYTLNKMLDADLLNVVKEVQVKNLTEKYYSSEQLTHVSEKHQAELDKFGDKMNNISSEWVQKHKEQTVQLLMLQHHEFLEAFQREIDSDEPTVFSANSELELSDAGTRKLQHDIFEVLTNAEKNDPEPNAKNKHQIKVLVEKWEKE